MRNVKDNRRVLSLFLLFFLVFFRDAILRAEVSTNLSLSGSVLTKLASIRHYRHSLDCYVEKKGDEYDELPSQKLALNGSETTVLESGSATFSSILASPFQREIRRVSFSQIVEQSSASAVSATSVRLLLVDKYAPQTAQYSSEKCNHWDGVTSPSDAHILGKIQIKYKVPAGVWAIKFTRSEWQGLFARNYVKSLTGTLNDTNFNSEAMNYIVWAKPESQLTLEIEIPDTVPGYSELINANLTFEPLLDNTINSKTLDDLKNYGASELQSLDEDFIRQSLTIAKNHIELTKLLGSSSAKEFVSISQSLFKIANSVIDSKQGLSVKTSAAIGSYSLAIATLTDLANYCKQVDIVLPLSNKSFKTSALRAAGFWLTRGLSTVKNYSFAEFDSLFLELAKLQANGTTYNDAVSLLELKDKIADAFAKVDDNVDMVNSPFLTALNSVRRTLKVVGTVGGNSIEVQNLQRHLEQLEKLEREFFAAYDEFGGQFNKAINTVINVSPLLARLSQLKLAQGQIANSMEQNISLLSYGANDDRNAVLTEITSLLANQVAIFEPYSVKEVPFFENIRKAFVSVNNNEQLIQLASSCIRGENLK